MPREMGFFRCLFLDLLSGLQHLHACGESWTCRRDHGERGEAYPWNSLRKSKATALQATWTSAPSTPTPPQTLLEDGGEGQGDAVLLSGKLSEAKKAAAFRRQPPWHSAISQLQGSILLFSGDILATKTRAANCSECLEKSQASNPSRDPPGIGGNLHRKKEHTITLRMNFVRTCNM